jgi:hypothetical protein
MRSLSVKYANFYCLSQHHAKPVINCFAMIALKAGIPKIKIVLTAELYTSQLLSIDT